MSELVQLPEITLAIYEAIDKKLTTRDRAILSGLFNKGLPHDDRIMALGSIAQKLTNEEAITLAWLGYPSLWSQRSIELLGKQLLSGEETPQKQRDIRWNILAQVFLIENNGQPAKLTYSPT